MTDTIIMYVVKGNSDQTEGRGSMVVKELFTTLEAALQCNASGRHGVQGQKNGCDIYERKWKVIDGVKWHADDILLWSYRKDWKGDWGYGWVDNRDAPVSDPEYIEYMRLRAKFEIKD